MADLHAITVDDRRSLAELVHMQPLLMHKDWIGAMRALIAGQTDFAAQRIQLMSRPVRGVSVIDGVAIVPIVGPIWPRAGSAGEFWMGGASAEAIRSTARQVHADPSVRAVVFDWDSPGGLIGGVNETADAIFDLRGKGKPIYSVANEAMYSAAYWIGSAAERISLPKTGGVGSIGVRAMHVDWSEFYKAAGLKITVFTSGKKKDQGSPFRPLSDEDETEIQAEIDEAARLFFAAVAKFRGLSVETVRGFEAGTFGGTKTREQPSALDVGLADKIETLEQAVSAASHNARRTTTGAGSESAQGGRMETEEQRAERERAEAEAREAERKKAAAASDDAASAARVDDLVDRRMKAREEAAQKRAEEIRGWCKSFGCDDLVASELIAAHATDEQIRERFQTIRASGNPAKIGGVPGGGRADGESLAGLDIDAMNAEHKKLATAARSGVSA